MLKIDKDFEKSTIDVLFINPRDLSIPVPYIKLANLAAQLRAKGFKSMIIDPKASKITHQDIIQIIQIRKPKVICVGAFPSTLPDAYTTINLIKKQFKTIPIVLEGYMVNADPNAVLKLNCNYGITGDVEYIFVDLCKAILSKEDINEQLPGLIINKGKSLIVNEKAYIRDLNELEAPAFDLLPLGKYYSASTNKSYMILFTDRGCPYNCSFCSSAAQMKYRFLSIENVIQQIEHLIIDLNIGWVEFMDLTFTINKRRTIEICDAIIARGLKFDWACETRADLLSEELLIKMKLAGCKKITIGVESGNEEIRYATGKKISNEEMLDAFNLCRKIGIKTMANVIIGHHNETVKDVLASISFLMKLNPFNCLITKMTPLPDVDVYTSHVKSGLIDKDVWYQYMKGEKAFPVIYPPSIGKFKMELLYRLSYIVFYLRPKKILEYLPLFTSYQFAYFSIKVFFRFVFGKTLYK